MSEETRRSIEVEVEVPGTPEQVWQAIASGPGITAWFVPTELEERVGGAIRFRFPIGLDSGGEVTAWEPPRRLAYEEREWIVGAPTLATEMIVEARAGGTCVVRLVNSLFASTDDWDDQLEGMKAGWLPFFRLLRLYLAHFPGQRCAQINAYGSGGESVERGWDEMVRAAGLGREVGDRIAAPSDAPALAGVVERVGAADKQREVIALVSEPGPGSAIFAVNQWGGKVHASVTIYLYGAEAEAIAERERPAWTAWMARCFPRE
jgi:uncharacterized protein YndB with AHSA1/START domain